MLRSIALLTAVLTLGTLAIAADPPATAPAPFMPTNKILKYHDGKSDGKRSIGGSGELIQFIMPEGYTNLTAISIFGARYGTPQPPEEDPGVEANPVEFKGDWMIQANVSRK